MLDDVIDELEQLRINIDYVMQIQHFGVNLFGFDHLHAYVIL